MGLRRPGECPRGRRTLRVASAVVEKHGYPPRDPSLGSAPGLKEYRNVTPTPFTQTQTQYTVSSPTKVVQELVECKTLLRYQSPYVKYGYRGGVVDTWGSDANIVIGDFVTFDDFIPRVSSKNPGGSLLTGP
jgi:carbohydrate-binding DOMON domain-containing protein